MANEGQKERLITDFDGLLTGAAKRIKAEGLTPEKAEFRASDPKDMAKLVRVRAESAGILAAPAVKKRPEGFKEIVERPYEDMMRTFEHYEISTDGMPTMDQIIAAPNFAQILELARTKMKDHQPELVIDSPLGRDALVTALNTHKVPGQTLDTYTYDFDNDKLWGDESNLKWDVRIAESISDISRRPNGIDLQANYLMVKLWRKFIAKQGLRPVSTARRDLSMHMKALANGKRLDPQFWTVLNAENVDETSDVAGGCWRGDRVGLGAADPQGRSDGLRLRSERGLDVPNA